MLLLKKRVFFHNLLALSWILAEESSFTFFGVRKCPPVTFGHYRVLKVGVTKDECPLRGQQLHAPKGRYVTARVVYRANVLHCGSSCCVVEL